jgi:hypothetical protein
MNARQAVFWIYLIALIIGIVSIVAIPIESWKYIADWQKALFGFQILLGICGVLIAYWVVRDGEDLKNHQGQFRRISDRLDEIEKRHREEDEKP